MEKFIDFFERRGAPLIIFFGLVVFLIGAFGVVPIGSAPFQSMDMTGRFTLWILGTIVTILGLILYVREILKPRAAFVVYDRHRVSPTARKYYEGAFTSGKEVLYLTIMSQHTLKEIERRVQKMLAYETVIKVLTLDPDLPVEAIESIRRHLNENSDNPSETTHQIRRAWEHWTAIKNKYPNIEVRKYKSTPTMQGVIVMDDYALFELIPFDTPPEERPGLIVTKKDNPEVFKLFQQKYLRLWKDAVE